ncbi:MAG: hypothetical protein ACFE7R_07195 [Candidatus Hodarchaeota archaeon]
MEIDSGPGLEPSKPPTGDFVVGATGLVSRTLTVWSRNIVAYLIIFGVLNVIMIGLQFALLWMVFGADAFILMQYVASDPMSFILSVFNLILLYPDPTILSMFIPLAAIIMVISMVIVAIVAGATIKYAFDDYGPRQADIGSSISYAISKAGAIIGAQLLVGAIGVAILAPAVLYLFTVTSYAELGTALLLFLVCIIVVLYVGVRLAPTIAVVIAEDRGPIDAIKRSWAITSGQFLHIFGGQIVLGIVVVILGLVLGLFIGVFSLMLGPFFLLISSMISGLIFGAITYVFQVVLYRDLEARHGETSQALW